MLRGQLPNWNPDRLSIEQAPAPRNVYWIGVFGDALEPEFTGYHPGIIIRGAKDLKLPTQTVSFVPVTTEPPRVTEETGRIAPYIFRLSKNPNPVLCSNRHKRLPHLVVTYSGGWIR